MANSPPPAPASPCATGNDTLNPPVKLRFPECLRNPPAAPPRSLCPPRSLHLPGCAPLVLALTALALFSMFSAASGDADTWFHLRTGAFIVQNHKLPAPDPFSWTTNMGEPAYPGEETTRDLNLKHEWLAQVILYLVYAAGGFPAWCCSALPA